MKYLYSLLLVLVATAIYAQQSPSIVWQKSFGGTNSDMPISIYLAPDGMLYLNGTTYSNDYDVRGRKGTSSMWLCKLDTTGYMYWNKCYGSSQFSTGLGLMPMNNNILLIGSVSGDGGDVTLSKGQNDVWAVKVDDNGAIVNDKNYGGSSFDRASAVVKGVDGSYVFCGTAYSTDGDIDTNKKSGTSTAWVVKVDTAGSVVWQSFIEDTTAYPFVFGMDQTNDSGYMFVGSSGGDVFASKLDKSGTQQWLVKYGGDSTLEYLYDVCDAGDGGYMVVGYSKSPNGDLDTNYGEEDVWVIKLDDTGSMVWQRNYGGTGLDIGRKVIQCLEGGFLLLGYTRSHDIDVSGNHNIHGSADIWAVKIDDTGAIEWQKCLGGVNSEFGLDVIQMQSGNFLICGYAESWTGDLDKNYGGYDGWLLKLSNPNIVSAKTIVNEHVISIYPNPANDKVMVSINSVDKGELALVDMQGRVLAIQALNEQIKQYSFDVSGVPVGNYYIRITIDDKELTKPLTIVR